MPKSKSMELQAPQVEDLDKFMEDFKTRFAKASGDQGAELRSLKIHSNMGGNAVLSFRFNGSFSRKQREMVDPLKKFHR